MRRRRIWLPRSPRLVDLYLNASRVEKMLAQLKYLSEHAPADTQTRQWYRYYKDEYDFSSDSPP